MPQMFPMNWIMLFVFVISVFYLTSVKLFFWVLPKPSDYSLSHASWVYSNKWTW